MKTISKCFSIVVILALLEEIHAYNMPSTTTVYGSLQGNWMTSRGGRVFSAFLGIPFAEPPVGLLRFMEPKPPHKWQGTRNATTEGNACLQRSIEGNEDCLYLNVFTHNFKNRLVPVMVYIHGGGFYGGSSSLDMYGPEYLMDKNIVLVTIQYRLGVFGFLSTEDSTIPGNMGLKDQVKALQWVNKNIKSFGGDPLKVTIFGNSAGSASVHLHMLSPMSKDLFARAISQSGTALSAFAMTGKGTARNVTHWLARQLHCPTNSSQAILQCLQSRNAAQIQQIYINMQDSNYEIRKVLLGPVIEEVNEEAFLTSNPLHATTDKPWLVGLNVNEGLFKINLTCINETIVLIQTDFPHFGPAVMFFNDTCSRPEEIANLIYKFYFLNSIAKSEMIISLEQMISDSWFIWPTLQSIQQHKGLLYCYLFDHRGEHSYTQIRNSPVGVSHMDELHYLFPQRQIFSLNMKKHDTYISKLMVKMWTMFAEQTNPTPYPISRNPQSKHKDKIIWKPTTNNNPKFFHIETTNLSMVSNIFSNRMAFWKGLPVRDKLT